MVKKNIRKDKNNFFGSLNLNLFNNKSAKKSYNGILIIAGILGALFLVSFATAGSWRMHNGNFTVSAVKLYANMSKGGGSIYAVENLGLGGSYNLTISEGTVESIAINVSAIQEGGTDNISQVNITFDQSFTISLLHHNGSLPVVDENVSISPDNTAISNGTGKTNFSITTLNGKKYIWLNNTGLIFNGSTANATFRFNISGAVPGTYNITVLVANSSIVGETNYSSNLSFVVNINDTTAPSRLTLSANTTGKADLVYNNAGMNVVNLSSKSQSVSIYVSVNITDFNETGAGGIGYAGSPISNVSILLYNETGIVNETNRSLFIPSGNVTGSQQSFAWNFSVHAGGSNLSEGRYRIEIRNFSDGAGNINNTRLVYNVTIDGTNPTVTVAKASTSTAKQIVLDLTLSDATSGINGKQCTTSGGGTEGIAISGNTGTQTATQTGLSCSSDYTYTVVCTDHAGNANSQSVTVKTDACTGGSSSGTGGTGGSGDVVGSASSSFWVLTYNEASTDLSEDSDGVSVNLAERYRVKVKVDTKLYYVGVVDTTDTTAKINVTTAAEDKEVTFSVGDVKKFDVNADDKYDLSITLNGVDSATGKADLSVVYIQEPVPAEEQAGVEEQAGTEGTTTPTGKSKAWIWIVIVLAILIIVGVILFGKKNSRHKNYGF